jgi:hypothetical protein
MTPIDSIIPRIEVMAIGVPYPVAVQAVRDTAIEFCRDSLFLRSSLDAVTLESGVYEYDLDPYEGSQARIVRVFDMWVDGARIYPYSVFDLQRTNEDWQTKEGQPSGYTMLSENKIRLYPIPDAASTLTGYAGIAPTRSATSLDDTLVDRWMDGIVSGALARVIAVPRQPYSDANAAIYHRSVFVSQVQAARIEVNLGQTNKGLSVCPRAFG